MKFTLLLEARERAVFSERSATEGAHRTRLNPLGAALLGWAAREYDGFKDSFAVFHSGQVRFSDALPLSAKGAVLYPMPQVLMEEKHNRGGVKPDKQREDEGKLQSSKVFVGRPDPPPGEKKKQYEAVSKTMYLAEDGTTLKATVGSRLRTATEKGRAKDGSLFGYGHLEAGRRYAATIEADDDVDLADFQRLRSLFDGKTLRLGGASGTSYGGEYQCTVVDGPDIWPVEEKLSCEPNELLRIWLMSDLALVDKSGAAVGFRVPPELLGLKDFQFVPECSAITARRYAPWNNHLVCRELERQTIQAGSVLSFRALAQPKMDKPKPAYGLWQEAGLGRLRFQPPLLNVAQGANPVMNATAPVRFTLAGEEQPEVEAQPIYHWAIRRSQEAEKAREQAKEARHRRAAGAAR